MESAVAEKTTRTITVLKPFVFVEPSTETNRLPPDHKFMPERDARGHYIPTDFEVEPWIAEHEYLSKQFADGAIERPEVRDARVAAAAAAERQRQAIIDLANAEAQAALARVEAAAAEKAKTDASTADDINTPVNKLNLKQGAGIAGADPAALADELNTPVNVLRARAAERAKATPKGA